MQRYLSVKGTVVVLSSDPVFEEGHVRSTTVPLKLCLINNTFILPDTINLDVRMLANTFRYMDISSKYI